MDVLVVGGGGREHALAWKLKQSPRVGKIYIAPGNGGTRLVGENVAISATDFQKLVQFVSEKHIGLTVVGPEAPLSLGIVDYFKSRGLRIWGPTKAAAQIESSKAFAKQLMKEAGVPTANFEAHSDFNSALAYLRRCDIPIVVKASGLANGKGVYICQTFEEAERALKELLIDKAHGDAGNEVVIEEYLEGEEISVHALCDGVNFVMFPPSQDHKRALDGDTGKNTGGMGVIAPVSWITPEMLIAIELHVIRPTLEALANRGIPFTGMLYPGLKISGAGIHVLEYNARFGDPEAQAYMRLLDNDLLDLFDASLDGTIADQKMMWHQKSAVTIVLASGGYPEASEDNHPITGIEDAERTKDVVVFHAGTKFDGALKTTSGRVLSVSAVGSPLKHVLDVAYDAVNKIHFEGMQFRRDIGAKSL
ncbi:MAG: phosphoribosylamine--glycine ligase [bacterium]|nr:phosphoribosylamine--glycine ligase [bacterium]